MGLFSDVGRKFEETKQSLTDTQQPEYVCTSCEELVREDFEYCPHCGEDSVEAAA
ncbi:zinc-ribbon domain [Halogranum gelatinilyticum]|uniref:Zinc-ribbon domain n=1 Tax=Halogranum gelatinilyticum TaxID=660521 RepID=A0A1G9U435_9EURY|nr:zinc-ribbon domain-containing protein [Halogranum gelatinilyticum]SDM54648.1 zinc-ribbon domain [Halogranum gelatinilyticum]